MNKKNLILSAIGLTALPGCAPNPAQVQGTIPAPWYSMPESPGTGTHGDAAAVQKSETSIQQDADELSAEKFETAARSVEGLLDAGAESLESSAPDPAPRAPFLSPSQPLLSGKPQDWVPWRMEEFMTEMSVTASGVLGFLTMRGTPTVRA